MNHQLIKTLNVNDISVTLAPVEEVEADELWSFVYKKGNQRWLWYAIDRQTQKILAYTLGPRNDETFLRLREILMPCGIRKFYTDDWGSYSRYLNEFDHVIGKENTQKIERKNLTLRTRIKRLTRKTICYSKSERMHDIVIGLFINRYEFGLQI